MRRERNDQTPDAAREAVLHYDALAEALLQMTREMAYPLASMRHLLKQSIRAERAAVSRARDAAWRSAVEAEAALWLYHRDTDDHFGISWERKREEYVGKVAGLMAMVLARMDTTGGANG